MTGHEPASVKKDHCATISNRLQGARVETRRPVWRLTIIQALKQDSDGSKAIRNGQTRCNLKVEPTGHTNI